MSAGQIYLYAAAWVFVPAFLCGFTARDVADDLRRMYRRRKNRTAAQQKGVA